MNSSRPDWDNVWMRTAEIVAERSLCSRAKVGAVVVTADNRVAAVSYNGPAPAFDHRDRPCTEWCPRAMNHEDTPDYSGCPSIHAEGNALLRADWTDVRGGTIYSSRSICINCARMIAAAGVSRAVHIVLPSDAHRDPSAVEDYLRGLGVEVDRM